MIPLFQLDFPLIFPSLPPRQMAHSSSSVLSSACSRLSAPLIYGRNRTHQSPGSRQSPPITRRHLLTPPCLSPLFSHCPLVPSPHWVQRGLPKTHTVPLPVGGVTSSHTHGSQVRVRHAHRVLALAGPQHWSLLLSVRTVETAPLARASLSVYLLLAPHGFGIWK